MVPTIKNSMALVREQTMPFHKRCLPLCHIKLFRLLYIHSSRQPDGSKNTMQGIEHYKQKKWTWIMYVTHGSSCEPHSFYAQNDTFWMWST